MTMLRFPGSEDMLRTKPCNALKPVKDSVLPNERACCAAVLNCGSTS